MTAPLPLPDVRENSIQTVPRQWSNDAVLSGITALLMFAPLAFGAAEAWASFVLELISGLLFILWALQQIRSGRVAVRGNPIFRPMTSFAVLILLQTILGLSAYRHTTVSALLQYFAYGIVCFLITQTLNRTRHIRKLAVAFTVYGSLVAVMATLQGLSSNKLYWIRAPRMGGWVYGPYVNHNHYAGLMEMLAPIPLVFAFSRYANGRQRWLAASAAAFMGATVFLSGSRGGMTAFAVQIAIFCWLLFRERTRSRVALLMGGFLLSALALITSIGGSEVTARIATLAGRKHSDLSAEMRLQIDRDALRMFSDRPLAGWGLATFADVYPQFRSFYTDSLVNAAHDDYLQLLTETGLIGFGIAIWFLVCVLRPAWRKTHNWPTDVNGIASLAALLGIGGILVHSFVDFNLEVPANAMLFYALCGVAAMDPRFRNFHREHRIQHRFIAGFPDTERPPLEIDAEATDQISAK